MSTEETIYLCLVFFAAGLALGHFRSPARRRANALVRALQRTAAEFAREVELRGQDGKQWAGERIVLKGVINADTRRFERVSQENELLKHQAEGLRAALGKYRAAAVELYNKFDALSEPPSEEDWGTHPSWKELSPLISGMREIGG